jgi:hypothetical protein
MKLRRILAVSLITAALLFTVLHGWHPAVPQIVHAQQYAPCAVTGASPLQCQSASRGNASIAAGASAVTINTTAIAPNSTIEVTFDSSLGTLLGVTCNTTVQQLTVTARATNSFTVTGATGNFAANPGCFGFEIIN